MNRQQVLDHLFSSGSPLFKNREKHFFSDEFFELWEHFERFATEEEKAAGCPENHGFFRSWHIGGIQCYSLGPKGVEFLELKRAEARRESLEAILGRTEEKKKSRL